MGETAPRAVPARPSDPWLTVPHPVVVVDRMGIIQHISGATRAVLPNALPGVALEVAVPALCRAHELVATSADPAATAASGIELPNAGGRAISARPMVLSNGDIAWWLVDDVNRLMREAEGALQRERERAAFLDEASAVLTASLNLERCMESVVRMASRHLADAAAVVAPSEAGRLPVVCGRGGQIDQRWVAVDPADVAGLSEALRGFPPVPSRWIDPATVPDWLVPRGYLGSVGSAVITPLPGHGVPAGALVLLRQTSERAFTEDEEMFARLFAERAGAALSSAQLYAEQSKITRTLLRELLPPQLHRLPGVDLAGGYRAAEDYQAIGGDFYDVYPAPASGGPTLVVLGDVCGKGLEAAVMTGKIRNTLHALAHVDVDHAGMLKLLNSALLSRGDTRFATLVLASISQHDEQIKLQLTSAGHPPPLIVRLDGQVEEAGTEGTLVGALSAISSRSFETVLRPGETCLLFTDGVTEARGGPLGSDLFGEDRLADLLTECAGMPASAVVERVMMVTAQWVNQQAHDDIAVVAITAPHRKQFDGADDFMIGKFTA